MCDVSIALRGHVRYTAENRAMGVEFQEIRQGDRPLLDYVLNRLKKPRVEDFADLEVITEQLAAVAVIEVRPTPQSTARRRASHVQLGLSTSRRRAALPLSPRR